MAAPKKNAPKTAAPKVETKEIVKSDAIRDWFKSNPEGTAVQCQKALAEQGIEVGSGHCQQILNKSKSGGKVDVAQIRLAADFVKTHGDIEAAIEAIDAVGGFIKSCGSPEKAKAALEAYQSVASVLA